ncbi:PAS domain S-box-containing protein [Mariprofundus ferrinatatus]|uniref:histidine kinase n=1 Tax=Mariprofundus ferrinatatus TaxID=1921087 RepID=A0A2K8LBB9_9PROT|nr:PAS domain S-box protein [Mariprofundus ferrinatatus]ATX82224.1 PAS domain S-box-containing protein [Mariprofundus ferrinatatus]
MDGELDRLRLLKHEQVKLLYAAMPASAFATFINAAVLAFVEWRVADPLLLRSWLAVILIVTSFRLAMALKFNKAQPGPDQVAKWNIGFNIGAASAGLMWGSASLLLFSEASLVHQVFLAFIIGGMCAGSVTSLSPLRLPVFSFILLSLVPLIVRFFMGASEVSYAMAGMLFLFLIVVLVSAGRIHLNFRQNIELRMQSEFNAAALVESEERFRELFEGNRSVELVIDPDDGSLVEVNRAAEEFYGYGRGQLLAMNISDINTLSKEEVKQEMALARSEKRTHFMFKHRLASGEVRDVEVHSGPIAWNKRRLLYSIVHDATKRVRAEFINRRTSEILEMIALAEPEQKVLDAICLMYEKINPEMKASILKLQGDQLFHSSAPSLPEAYCKAINGMKIGEGAGSCGSAAYLGRQFIVEDIASDPLWADYKDAALHHHLRACWSEPIFGHDRRVLGTFAMYFDHSAAPDSDQMNEIRNASRLVSLVMEKERREAMLRKLSQATEQAGESVLITDRHGNIEYVNPSFTRITGYAAEDVLGKNPRVLKSGNQTDEYYKRLWATISSGNIWHNAVIDRRKDGSQYPAMMTISPILNESGEITHYVGIQQDMTDHELLEEKFRQAQKMEALGTLVGGIAHDFNNMLAGMTGNIYLIKRSLAGSPEIVRKLDAVEALSFRAAEMIKQLLVFARKGRIEMKPFGLTSFVKEVAKLHKASIPENVSFQSDYCNDELVVNGDATQLQQVLMNLLNNARDAVAGIDDPMITLKIEEYIADERFAGRHPDIESRQFAHLIVADNGCGISDAEKEHIFEPFFSTKEVGLGSGLGLSMAYGAIQSHHGMLEVESKIGKGSSFHIYLPLLEEKTIQVVSDEIREAVSGKDELILVVDDNAEIRETSREVLESIGYRVVEASNGLEAVDAYIAKQQEIAVIIMDVVMPRLSGVKAVERIKALNPDAKVLFSTGYDRDETLKGEMPSDDYVVLSKPYSIVKLSNAIREQIDS